MNTQSPLPPDDTDDLMNEIDQSLPVIPDDVRSLLTEIESSLPSIGTAQTEIRSAVADVEVDIGGVNDLLGDIDAGLDSTEKEIREWPLEKKRAEAVDSKEPLVLKILATDPSPVIRTLVCCNEAAPSSNVRKIAKEGTDHMRLAIAHNGGVASNVLDTVVDNTAEEEVLQAAKSNDNTNPITRHRINTILGIDEAVSISSGSENTGRKPKRSYKR